MRYSWLALGAVLSTVRAAPVHQDSFTITLIVKPKSEILLQGETVSIPHSKDTYATEQSDGYLYLKAK